MMIEFTKKELEEISNLLRIARNELKIKNRFKKNSKDEKEFLNEIVYPINEWSIFFKNCAGK